MDPIELERVLGPVTRRVPGLGLLRHYDRQALPHDIVAAGSVCAVLIPSAMAYGELAGLAPVAGLYAALLAMTAYALIGGSRQLIVGPEGSTAVLTTTIVAPLAAGDPSRYAATAGVLAIMAGALLMVAGLVRLGFVAEYLSRPVQVGYLNGVVIVMVVTQAGKLFGVSLGTGTAVEQLGQLVGQLSKASWVTFAYGIATIACLVALRRWLPKVPGALVLVVASIAGSAILDLASHGIAVVGNVPAGLPRPQLPAVGLDQIGVLIPGAISVALLTFPDSVLTARGFAQKRGYEVDANQELIAIGASDVSVAFFHGFPIGASGSRTAVNDAAGGRTPLVGLLAGLVLVVFLLFLTPLIYPLPTVTLASIIIVAAAGIFSRPAVRELFRIDRWSGWLTIGTTAAVVVLGMVPAILIAVLLSLFYVIGKISRPHDAVLGRVGGLDGFHDVEVHEDSEVQPGLVVYRFDAQLFFANASYFVERIRALTAESRGHLRWFLLDAEAIPTIDPSAAQALLTLEGELRGRGVVLALARVKEPLRVMLLKTGVLAAIGSDHLYPTVRSAVDAYLRANGASGRG